MRYSVVRLLAAGRPLSREARARSAPITGCLRVEEHRNDARGRWLRVARLFALDRAVDPDVLPALYEPQLVTMTPIAFTLAGFEVVEGAAVAQTWLCRELAPVDWAALQAGRAAGWAPGPTHPPAAPMGSA